MNEKWRQALGRMTYGIYVLTTAHGGEMNGMIASWVSQISHTPPLVMAAVHPNRYSHQLILKSGAFALHIPGRARQSWIRQFKGPDPVAKFNDLEWFTGKTGCPILAQCHAYLECELRATYQPGNHTLFIGEVVEADALGEGDSLSTLDYPGVYRGDV